MILWQALIVFVILFVVVGVIGLLSYRFRAGGEESAEEEISEWGLGGRRFGTVITWFLVGGDLYTAYTLIAVPGLVFGMGAIGLAVFQEEPGRRYCLPGRFDSRSRR